MIRSYASLTHPELSQNLFHNQNKVNICEYCRENIGTAWNDSEYLQFNIIPSALNFESHLLRRIS